MIKQVKWYNTGELNVFFGNHADMLHGEKIKSLNSTGKHKPKPLVTSTLIKISNDQRISQHDINPMKRPNMDMNTDNSVIDTIQEELLMQNLEQG